MTWYDMFFFLVSCFTTRSFFSTSIGSKVNVRTGKLGWHKRIAKSSKKVTREAQLTDGVDIDPARDAITKIHAAAKQTVLKRKQIIGKDISKDYAPASSSSTQAVPEQPAASTASVKDVEVVASDGDNGSDASSDDEPSGAVGGFLSTVKAFVPNDGKASAKAAAKSTKVADPTSTTPQAVRTPKAKAKPKAQPSVSKATCKHWEIVWVFVFYILILHSSNLIRLDSD